MTVLEKKQKRKNSPPDEKAWRKGEGGRAKKQNTEETKKIPCTLPMNRVEDIHIPCTVGRMKKGPPRARSRLVLRSWKNEERPSKVKIPLGP